MSMLPGDEGTLGPPNKIPSLVHDFQEQLNQGLSPRIEDFLAWLGTAQQPVLLTRLLQLEWPHRQARGEQFTMDEYVARFSSFAFTVTVAWKRWQAEKPDNTDGKKVVSAFPETLLPLPAALLSAPAVSSSPRAIPPEYELVECLGIGGMGEVYKAIDPRLKRTVAIKRIKTDVFSPERLVRFRIEAEAMARLQHPHIVQVHALTESAGEPLLVLEFVPGGSLEQRLAEGPLSSTDAARLVAILAWAMHAAHGAGLVHRDLKPDNILMAPPIPGNPGTVAGGFPKISDFGLALLTDLRGHTLAGTAMGTPDYMSPEQAAGRTDEVGPAADVWALGVILYRCLTGYLPWQGRNPLDTLERIKSQPPLPLPRKIPAPLAAIVEECLVQNLADRPTASQLARKLEEYLATEPTEEIMVPPTRAERKKTGPTAIKKGRTTRTKSPSRTRPPVRRRRRWLVWGLGVFLLLLILGGAALLLIPMFLPPIGPPPHLVAFDVEVYDGPGERARFLGTLGRDVMTTAPGQSLKIHLAYEGPVMGYLLFYDSKGNETLLWPVNERGLPDANRRPSAQEQIVLPAETGSRLVIDGNAPAGAQALVFVGSRRWLPSFDTWQKRRRMVRWNPNEELEEVWLYDGEHVHPARPRPRHKMEKKPLPPPWQVDEVCKSLSNREPIEIVQAMVFPNRPAR